METIHVNLGPRSYDIAITSDGDGLAPFLKQCAPSMTGAFIVTDDNVRQHASRIFHALKIAGVRVHLSTVSAGENTKRLEMASRLYDDLAEWPADRRTLVVAVGGGVIGDLAGFAAATYNRGLPLFMVPTTLLAMVDSSVGGKVGINHKRGKNLIGAFHQPDGVWIDTRLLETLPDREYRSGMAEVVKYGMILDEPFFNWQEENATAMRDRDPAALRHLIAQSCRLKATVVEQDEREETGIRVKLNYGHTFAHAFEAIGGYGEWLHGEAVSAGMITASRLAEKRGMIDASITERQRKLLVAFGLPVVNKPEWNVDDLLYSMYRDKKTEAGKLRFILPKRIGDVVTVDGIPEEEVIDVLTGSS